VAGSLESWRQLYAARASFAAVALASGCADLAGIEERVPVSGEGGGYGGAGAAGGGGDAGSGGGGGGSCVDTRSDPHHCGACGHDCLGGECEDGVCGVVLVSGAVGIGIHHRLITDLAPDGQAYFARWKLPGTIYQVTKADRATPEVVVELFDDGWAHDLAIDHEWIYFSNFSSIDSASHRGLHARRRSGGDPVQLVRGEPAVSGVGYLSLDGADLWFTTSQGTVAVGRARFGGTPTETIATRDATAPLDWYGGDVVSDAGWLYTPREDGVVHAYARDGSRSRIVESSLGPVVIVGLEAGWLYVRDAAGTVHRRRADGEGEPEAILGDVTASRLHQGWIYAVAEGSKTVLRRRLDRPEEAAEVLATSEAVIGDLAVDAASVLWITRDRGQLYRRAL
jgi:hypothetical protein